MSGWVVGQSSALYNFVLDFIPFGNQNPSERKFRPDVEMTHCRVRKGMGKI